MDVEEESETECEEDVSELRLDIQNLLQNWDTTIIDERESVASRYLCGLIDQPREISLTADWDIIEDLTTKLDRDAAEFRRNHGLYEIAVIRARKKLGLMLQKLDSSVREGLITNNDFKKWIEEKLDTEDWERYLKFVDHHKQYLSKEEFADELRSLEELNVVIDVEYPDDIKNQLTEYHGEEDEAYKMPQQIKKIGHGVHKLCKCVMRRLKDLQIKEEESQKKESKEKEIEEEERPDGVQPTIQADDGVKHAVPDENEGIMDADYQRMNNDETMDVEEENECEEDMSELRLDILNLLQNWDNTNIKERERVSRLYLCGLLDQPSEISLTDDWELIEDLTIKLDHDDAGFRRKHGLYEMTVLRARLKLSLMFQKLDSSVKEGLITDNDFKKWIEEKLDTDWGRYLQFIDNHKQNLSKVEGFADELKSLDDLNVEINVENPDGIKQQLTEFLGEECEVYTMGHQIRNIDYCVRELCSYVMDTLKDLQIKEQESQEQERPDVVQDTISLDDCVEIAVLDDIGRDIGRKIALLNDNGRKIAVLDDNGRKRRSGSF